MGTAFHTLKDHWVVFLRVYARLFEALSHDLRTETLDNTIKQNVLNDALPRVPHLCIECDDTRAKTFIGVIVFSIGQDLKVLVYLLKPFWNALHLARSLGGVDDAKTVVTKAAHPFGMTGNSGASRFRPQHVMEKDVMCKHNDLSAFRSLSGQPFGNSLHARMVERRNGIIDNYSVIPA